MATAELVDVEADGFEVRFEGSFCRMCCDYDYFEDLAYELGELGVDPSSVAADIDDEGDERFRVGYDVRS